MDLFRHPLFQALLVTIIALWLLGGVLVTPRVGVRTWALLAFALVVVGLAWWRVIQRREP